MFSFKVRSVRIVRLAEGAGIIAICPPSADLEEVRTGQELLFKCVNKRNEIEEKIYL